MNTNSIVDRQNYFNIKGIENYFIYDGNLYHNNKKKPFKSCEKITSPFDIEFNDICEVRDFLEAFHYYPDTENDYLFHKDMSYDKDDEFVEADVLISSYNVLYVAVEDPETKKFMIVPCMNCVQDNTDIDTSDEDYCIDYPHILINEETKKDITDDIVAYDSKSGKYVVFMGTGVVDNPLDMYHASEVPVAHIVNKYKVERIADFSYQNEIDLFETIFNWFTFKGGKDLDFSTTDKNDIVHFTCGSINATPNADNKDVTIYSTFVYNKKRGGHSVYYASYKNPGDKYVSLYQVNTYYPRIGRLGQCYNRIKCKEG